MSLRQSCKDAQREAAPRAQPQPRCSHHAQLSQAVVVRSGLMMGAPMAWHVQRIIESLGLEKASKTPKSKHQPFPSMPFCSTSPAASWNTSRDGDSTTPQAAVPTPHHSFYEMLLLISSLAIQTQYIDVVTCSGGSRGHCWRWAVSKCIPWTCSHTIPAR